MRYFLSAGEPSGDLHGANLQRELARLDPAAEFVGLGGPRMREAGCRLYYPLAEKPVMGVWAALAAYRRLVGVLHEAEKRLDEERPDVLILIDYPGFHWHLARRAKERGIAVVYFVPPQIWSWATWRVEKVRRYIDLVLCTLPFEAAWYHERGVPQARYVGHPFFDDLACRSLDAGFLAHQRTRRPNQIVALLPGSRKNEVQMNIQTLIHAAERIDQQAPGYRYLVAGFKEAHRPLIEAKTSRSWLPIEVHIGRTPEILSISTAAVAVSGSVSLELMYYGVPSTILYTVDPLLYYVIPKFFLETPYITLVNLMAGQEIYPEFLAWRDASRRVSAPVVEWLHDEAKRSAVVRRLDKLKQAYATPGATKASAEAIVEFLHQPASIRRAG